MDTNLILLSVNLLTNVQPAALPVVTLDKITNRIEQRKVITVVTRKYTFGYRDALSNEIVLGELVTPVSVTRTQTVQRVLPPASTNNFGRPKRSRERQ